MSVTLALLAALTGSSIRDAGLGSCPQRAYPIVALLPRADATDVPIDASIWVIDNCSPCVDEVRLVDTSSQTIVPLARVARETSAGTIQVLTPETPLAPNRTYRIENVFDLDGVEGRTFVTGDSIATGPPPAPRAIEKTTLAVHCELPGVHVTFEAAANTITFAEDDLGSGRRGFALDSAVLTAPAEPGDAVSFVLVSYDIAGRASAPSDPCRVELPSPPVDDDDSEGCGCSAGAGRATHFAGAWFAGLLLLALRRRR